LLILEFALSVARRNIKTHVRIFVRRPYMNGKAIQAFALTSATAFTAKPVTLLILTKTFNG
jgi:hypothetical protein